MALTYQCRMKLTDVLSAPWAIDPAKLQEIQAVYAMHMRGDKVDIGALEARLGRPLMNQPKAYEVVDGVAVCSVEGVVAKRMNMFMQISGGTSSEIAASNLEAALADPNVHSIIQYTDSPGGTVDGTQVYSDRVFKARSQKPIVTLASGCMASAAYWFGSAAQAVYIAEQTTIVGQIGVVEKHVDTSEAEAKAGNRTTEIYAGQFKRIATAYAPLTDAGRQSIQDRVDYVYSIFVADVARNRGVPVEAVLRDMADGRIFIGQQAVDAGLVDGITSLPALIEQLNRDRSAGNKTVSLPNPTGATSMTMNREALAAQHPELLQQVLAEGHAAGASAERARIKAVEGALIPGHEALIAAMKFDGTTDGGSAALAVLAAERTVRTTQATALAGDAPAPVAQTPSRTVPDDGAARAQADAEALAKLPVEERCKAEWAASAALQNEFGSLGAYTAYAKASQQGLAKVHTKG